MLTHRAHGDLLHTLLGVVRGVPPVDCVTAKPGDLTIIQPHRLPAHTGVIIPVVPCKVK